jgi:hypothetical protein
VSILFPTYESVMRDAVASSAFLSREDRKTYLDAMRKEAARYPHEQPIRRPK